MSFDPVYDLIPGDQPLLISIPHGGTRIPDALRPKLAPLAQALPDTDHHVPRLYAFAPELGIGVLAARWSRYAVDLNRPADDAPLYESNTTTTGLFTDECFDGSPLLLPGERPDPWLRADILDGIWRPYHACLAHELARLKDRFGYALLWDAHSVRSVLPRLFEGRLPDLCLGTNDGQSCDPELTARLVGICAAAHRYTQVLDGRFKGGWITRHYGQPHAHVHAVQMELSQAMYMDEDAPWAFREDLAADLVPVLRTLLETMLVWGRERYGASS